ncbi:hypothetical protein IAD21_01693 [Abditibacteriota bacterium]|nr:hypothetical protein IAD21_01693 [Abditibacteriota bacterium]
MKTPFPILAAAGLVILWAAMLVTIPRTLLLLPNLPSDMPLPTMAILWADQPLGRTILPLLILAAALLLSFRQFVGWIYALVLCFASDFAFLGLLIPIMDNLNANNGNLGSSFPLLPTLASVQGMLVIVALLLNQALFVSLIVKRRNFAR